MRKLKDCRGTSLMEMLVATLILMLATSAAVSVIPAAVTAYRGVAERANTDLTLSAGIYAVREELGSGRDASVEDGVIRYRNRNGNYAELRNDEEKGAVVDIYKGYRKEGDPAMSAPLVQEAVSETRILRFSNASVEDGIVTLDLAVYRGKAGTPAAAVEGFRIQEDA